MSARSSFDYTVVRVVPRVEREEFINAGVILFCRTRAFLDARIALDERRILALAPELDGETLAEIREHLASIPRICGGAKDAGPVARLSRPERFHWLVAPRSTVIQPSPVHSGLCDDPAAALERLFAEMVLLPETATGDSVVLSRPGYDATLAALRHALAAAGLDEHARREIEAALRAIEIAESH